MRTITRFRALLALLAVLVSCPLRADDQPANPLKSVKNFMYQTDGLAEAGAVDKLAQSGYDMVIVAPTFDTRGNEKFHAAAMVKSLHDAKPGRIVLALLNIGQAENFRTYWGEDWHGEMPGAPAKPGYLIGADPNADPDTFLVRFWRSRWQAVFLSPRGLIHRIMAAGFDGVCLDGLDAYEDDPIGVAADKDKVDPANAMVSLVSAVRDHVRQAKPDGVVLALNASDLIDDQPKFAQAIDGLVAEDTWFSGSDDAKWGDPAGGDVPNTDSGDDSTQSLVRQYHKFLDAGLPVFTIDYCVNPENAAKVYRESSKAGFVPLVTQAAADQVTTTPPPGDAAPTPIVPATQP